MGAAFGGLLGGKLPLCGSAAAPGFAEPTCPVQHMGYLIRPLRGHLPLKGKAGGCHFKAFPFRGRWLAEGQTDEAGGQRPPAGRRGRRPLRQNRKIPPSRRGGYPHPPASEDSSTRRGGTLGRPETARWGHRALQKIKSTFGYTVGAGPRPARNFIVCTLERVEINTL